jgi:uncharacterized protein
MSLPLLSRAADVFGRLLIRHPGKVALAVLLVTALSGLAASRLGLNTNQLDLIDQDLREVQDVKRVVDMVGGAGHLIIPLRGADSGTLKAVADDLSAMLAADTENIRDVTHKLDISFVRDRAALFMETEDLAEVKRRVDLWLRDQIRRADPFFFEIRPTEPVELELDDIIDNYRRVGGKAIADDYYISDDGQMTLLVVKPMWDTTELGKTGDLLVLLRERLAAYSAENAHGVHLVEDYAAQAPEDPKRIEYGFTGSYVLNYDESFEIKGSLVPVSGLAFAGIVAVLLIFFRRRVGAVALVLTGLVLGVTVVFGYAKLAVGELNMITSILAGILLGLGIDFGIHLVYRLREELGRRPLEEAILETIRWQGPASFVSAAGIGAAFFSLMLSDFRGFSEFGLIAGVGVLFIGLVIYAWAPAILLLAERRWPGSAKKLIGVIDVAGMDAGEDAGEVSAEASAGVTHDRIPGPKRILVLAGVFALALAAFAPTLRFDYNTRALMVEGRGSMVLSDEIGRRFQTSSDPVAIFTETLDEAEKVYRALTADPERFRTIEEVVSIFTFLPPRDRQEANAEILRAWKAELERIDPGLFPDEVAERWDDVMTLLSAEPWDVEGLPRDDFDRFRNLPEARPENQGFLTFVYPGVDMYDGEQMLAFADEVDTVKTEDGRTYHAAGLPLLYAVLARIVLHDGRTSVALTLGLLVVLLLVDLRHPGRMLVALLPLVLGVAMMLGAMALLDASLNFMNIVVFPIVLGYGVSHGVYLMHRFAEGTPPRQALRSVGTAVACSTLTTLAGWAALLAAAHRGLQTMGVMACLGMAATLVVSFTIMPAVLQLLHDRRSKGGPTPSDETGASTDRPQVAA